MDLYREGRKKREFHKFFFSNGWTPTLSTFSFPLKCLQKTESQYWLLYPYGIASVDDNNWKEFHDKFYIEHAAEKKDDDDAFPRLIILGVPRAPIPGKLSM